MDAFNHRFNQTELDQGQVPRELQELGSHICTILFFVSIGCCVLVLLGYAFIRYFDPAHDRLTLRLLIYATIANIVLGIAGSFRINPPTRDNEAGCQAVMFFYVSANIFSTIAITCIAVNLQIVFVHGASYSHLERWYLAASILPAIVIAIIPIFPKVEGYAYNKHMGDCWYMQSSDHVTSLWALMGLYIWLMLSTAYCIIALILVLWKMYTEELRINEHLRSHPTNHRRNHHKWLYHWPLSLCFRPPIRDPVGIALDHLEEPRAEEQHNHYRHIMPRPTRLRHMFSSGMQLTMENIRRIRARQLEVSYLAKVAGRVIWFPVILVLTRIWGVIGFIMSYTSQRINPFMLLMSYVSVPMQGIFLLFIFLFDPSLHHAIQIALGRKGPPINEHDSDSQEKAHSPQAFPRRPGIDVLQSPSWLSLSGDISLSTWESDSRVRSMSVTSTPSSLSDDQPSSSSQQQDYIMHPLPGRNGTDPRRATSDSVAFTNSHHSTGSALLPPSSVASSSRRAYQDRTDRRAVRSMGEEALLDSSHESIWEEFRQL